ncbi:MAG: nitroreductase [Deltaproteobacteria bacterium]|nr:nitroreductase [Deltaproteobacteria bacterium]MBW2205619.1 nitroreductase [Deltaproteobacteria bacterium]
MDVIEGIQTRHSIRAFKDTPIPEETLHKILKAASLSPSYTNTQPWEVAVVSGKKKEGLSSIIYDLASNKAEGHPDLPSPQGWAPEHVARSGEHGARRLAALGVQRDDESGREKMALMNYRFYGAPCAIFLFMEGSLNEWSIFDMGLFTQNLILAAHSLGLESCLQASVPKYSLEIKQFLGIPEHKKLIICISLGYADADAKLNTYRAIKQDPEEFTKWFR